MAPTRLRTPIFHRRMFARGSRRWYLGIGVKLRAALVGALRSSANSTEVWLKSPQRARRPFDLSCKDLMSRIVKDRTLRASKEKCPPPGCADCKRPVMLVIRAATQLACRLEVMNDDASMWLLRATRNSDEVRNPQGARMSVQTTGRRLVRGSPFVRVRGLLAGPKGDLASVGVPPFGVSPTQSRTGCPRQSSSRKVTCRSVPATGLRPCRRSRPRPPP